LRATGFHFVAECEQHQSVPTTALFAAIEIEGKLVARARESRAGNLQGTPAADGDCTPHPVFLSGKRHADRQRRSSILSLFAPVTARTEQAGFLGASYASPLHLGQSVLLVAVGYYAAGLVGLLVTFPPSGISVIWPANAVLLVPLLVMPLRYWWMYLLAAVPMHLHLVINFQRPEPSVLVAICQFASNAVYAIVAALLVRPIIGTPPRFDSLRNMVAFVLLAGIVATAIACAVAVLLFLGTGWATDFWPAWWQRVRAGLFPTITITPLILLACAGQLVGSERTSPRAYAELGLVVVGLLAAGIPMLAWEAPAQTQGNMPGLLLAPLPLLLWAAVRLGPGGTSVSLVVVASVALAAGYLGRGPFAIQSSAENVLSLQTFLIAISIPLVLLAALVEERQRAEDTLRLTEARMAMAAASTDTGLWQYDVRDGHFWATHHCRSMFGLRADSPLAPEALLGAVHPDDRAIVIEAMQGAAHAGETPRRNEFRVVQPSGQHRWYLATASTEFAQNGKPVRVSGIFRDVTARKKAEQEAEQLEDALRAAQRELARVSRQTTVGAMAASIAHEINQPLSALVTNGSIGLLLLAKPDSDRNELRDVLKRIIDDGHRASHIIASIQAMFRKDQRERSPMGVDDVVRDVLALVRGELASHGVSLHVDLRRELPPVTADPVQLQQVLLNLIMNAVEAMSSVDTGERLLLVKSDLHGPRDVVIAVEDSGPGIDPSHIDRVFDAFFTTKSRGMGLGLSICKSIVESHGGRLWASHRIPHGSVFHVQLPSGGSGE
jgi:PAS domain S-box-containing protein